jgi:hypothetical protein
MLSPSVMFIESAVDSFKDPKFDQLKASQQKELTSFGDYRAQQLGATGLSDDFRKGYELGLSTARVILAGSAALALKGVKPSDVL